MHVSQWRLTCCPWPTSPRHSTCTSHVHICTCTYMYVHVHACTPHMYVLDSSCVMCCSSWLSCGKSLSAAATSLLMALHSTCHFESQCLLLISQSAYTHNGSLTVWVSPLHHMTHPIAYCNGYLWANPPPFPVCQL